VNGRDKPGHDDWIGQHLNSTEVPLVRLRVPNGASRRARPGRKARDGPKEVEAAPRPCCRRCLGGVGFEAPPAAPQESFRARGGLSAPRLSRSIRRNPESRAARGFARARSYMQRAEGRGRRGARTGRLAPQRRRAPWEQYEESPARRQRPGVRRHGRNESVCLAMPPIKLGKSLGRFSGETLTSHEGWDRPKFAHR
jgi:hypothetical protein